MGKTWNVQWRNSLSKIEEQKVLVIYSTFKNMSSWALTLYALQLTKLIIVLVSGFANLAIAEEMKLSTLDYRTKRRTTRTKRSMAYIYHNCCRTYTDCLLERTYTIVMGALAASLDRKSGNIVRNYLLGCWMFFSSVIGLISLFSEPYGSAFPTRSLL